MEKPALELKILGPGCMNCRKLAENAEAAARELDLAFRMEKVTDIQEMMSYGIRRTPTLVVNGKVAVEGRVPPPQELMSILAQQIA
ncbi:MAG: thioredoxin family protein [Bryobacteraceae bacterium]